MHQVVLQFLDWEVSRWTALAAIDIGDGPDMKEGRSAYYAFRQANIRAGMRAHCIKTWSDIPKEVILTGDFKDKATGFVISIYFFCKHCSRNIILCSSLILTRVGHADIVPIQPERKHTFSVLFSYVIPGKLVHLYVAVRSLRTPSHVYSIFRSNAKINEVDCQLPNSYCCTKVR